MLDKIATDNLLEIAQIVPFRTLSCMLCVCKSLRALKADIDTTQLEFFRNCYIRKEYIRGVVAALWFCEMDLAALFMRKADFAGRSKAVLAEAVKLGNTHLMNFFYKCAEKVDRYAYLFAVCSGQRQWLKSVNEGRGNDLIQYHCLGMSALGTQLGTIKQELNPLNPLSIHEALCIAITAGRDDCIQFFTEQLDGHIMEYQTAAREGRTDLIDWFLKRTQQNIRFKDGFIQRGAVEGGRFDVLKYYSKDFAKYPMLHKIVEIRIDFMIFMMKNWMIDIDQCRTMLFSPKSRRSDLLIGDTFLFQNKTLEHSANITWKGCSSSFSANLHPAKKAFCSRSWEDRLEEALSYFSKDPEERIRKKEIEMNTPWECQNCQLVACTMKHNWELGRRLTDYFDPVSDTLLLLIASCTVIAYSVTELGKE